MTKKKIIVECCVDCPWYEDDTMSCFGSLPYEDRPWIKPIIEMPEDFDVDNNIYEKCPLEDAE